MWWEKRLGGIAVAGAALLHLMPEAWAGERMQLGAPLAAAEFQTQVGDRIFFSEGSADLGTRARTALEAQATWLKRHTTLSVTIEGRDVIIVEDVIDSGRTISYLRRNLATRHPRSLALCVLLDKVSRREVDVEVDYVGFAIPDEFVVGYGLDYDGRHRNLADLAVLDPVAAPA